MISKFSVKKPYTVLVGVVLAIVLGVVSLTRMTADLLPSISLPYVIIMTTYVGASPETVESAVTKPVEASMATVSNIESIRSVSSENYSMVILEFAQTANMDSVSLEIRENLDQVKSYWTDDFIGSPIIMKLNPDMLPVMIAAVGVEGMSNARVSDYVENTIVPEIESIEGVASVSTSGIIEESVNVIIRQDKVDSINALFQADILTVDTISALLSAQNFSMPAGYITEEGISYMVRVGNKPSSLEEMQNLPLLDLHMDGVDAITLQDVADVFYVDNSDEVYTNVNGKAGVILSIQKQTGYSTGEVSDKILERFAGLEEENPAVDMITLMDQGVYIDLVVDAIANNILVGAFLAILILLLFLKDLRPTLVVAVSIPISLVTAIVCMYFSGVTLNVISLSGLALGIGMLVDNSIVAIENIYRLRGEGRSNTEAAIEGAREVGGAIMASTLTTVCVFLPIVFTEGITRQLFVDMGLTIAYSLLASLIIAMTVVPAMASKLLQKTEVKKEGKLFALLGRGYEKALRLALKGKAVVLLLVVILLVVSALAAISNGTAFMTDMDSTQLTVKVTLPEDATLRQTGDMTDKVVEAIMQIEEVEDAGAMMGGSTMSALTGGSGANNSTTVYVTLKEDKNRSNEELAEEIMTRTQGLEAEISIDTSSMDMSALGGSGISILVKGRDLDTLRRMAGEVAGILESVEGLTDISDGMEDAGEELRITVDKEKAIKYGLTVAQVYAQIAPQMAASSAATVLAEAARDYNVYIISEKDAKLTIRLLEDMEVEWTGADGTQTVPLREIADFTMEPSLSSIQRSSQTRYLTVSAAIADGYNVGLVAPVVERALADYEVPAGYELEFAGENETINDALGQLALMLALALVFMYLIMVAQFQSLLSPFIIMFTIPLAFTGGLFGLFFTGNEVSVMSMIGFVMLSGIIVNNGIVLIDYMNRLRESGMAKREAILTAGRTRLRPVLMTALTTILALSGMVFSHDMGSDMMRPVAIVTVGGLVYGTILTLVVIPCAYDIFIRDKIFIPDKKGKKEEGKQEEAKQEEAKQEEVK